MSGSQSGSNLVVATLSYVTLALLRKSVDTSFIENQLAPK